MTTKGERNQFQDANMNMEGIRKGGRRSGNACKLPNDLLRGATFVSMCRFES